MGDSRQLDELVNELVNEFVDELPHRRRGRAYVRDDEPTHSSSVLVDCRGGGMMSLSCARGNRDSYAGALVTRRLRWFLVISDLGEVAAPICHGG